MKTVIFVSLFLCLLVTAINADKSHKHQHKRQVKSGHEEHKKHDTDIQHLNEDEKKIENHQPANEQTETKPAVAGRKHRNNHHGKNKKGGSNSESHTGRSRKAHQTKPHKHNGQRSHHNNKHHGRKHGRGKQVQ